MVRLLKDLSEHFRTRSAGLQSFNASAALAFEHAAEHVDDALATYLEQPLSVIEAAVEYGWNYEALRQRLKREPDLAMRTGRGLCIRRRDMDEHVGRGRGPRKKAVEASSQVQVAEQPPLEPMLQSLYVRAARARRGKAA